LGAPPIAEAGKAKSPESRGVIVGTSGIGFGCSSTIPASICA
jgi:hypothetical protein